MNKKKKEGEGMKKENVHAKHKKSLAERFWKQKYLFFTADSIVGMGHSDLLCTNDRTVYVLHQLHAAG